MPTLRSEIFSTPSVNVAVLNSGRGSRPGFTSSAMMSETVGTPKRLVGEIRRVERLRNALSPMMLFSGRPDFSAMLLGHRIGFRVDGRGVERVLAHP